MKVKKALIEANRLDDVQEVLKKITYTSDGNFPVYLFIDYDNTAKYRVDGDKVRSQAIALSKQIEADCVVPTSDFIHLYQLIESRTRMNMHNYANSALHRKESDVDLDSVRTLVIIKSIIDSMGICDDKEMPWDVPAGWAKVEE